MTTYCNFASTTTGQSTLYVSEGFSLKIFYLIGDAVKLCMQIELVLWILFELFINSFCLCVISALFFFVGSFSYWILYYTEENWDYWLGLTMECYNDSSFLSMVAVNVAISLTFCIISLIVFRVFYVVYQSSQPRQATAPSQSLSTLIVMGSGVYIPLLFFLLGDFWSWVLLMQLVGVILVFFPFPCPYTFTCRWSHGRDA